MKSTKNMILGLLIVLVGISVGIVPLPEPFSRIVAAITPSSPSSPGVTVSYPQQTLSWIAYTIIVIGIIVTLIGYFRTTADLRSSEVPQEIGSRRKMGAIPE